MAFSLKSRAFKNGDEIPVEFTADGDDVSPPLSWSGHPPNTASFALVVKDRDVRAKTRAFTGRCGISLPRRVPFAEAYPIIQFCKTAPAKDQTISRRLATADHA